MACNLLEGVPGKDHPIRKTPALRNAFTLYAKAKQDAAANGRAFDAFLKVVSQAEKDAAVTFAKKDAITGKETFKPERARRFLEAWVFGPNAPLRVGDEGFEPRAELAAVMVHAACFAGRREEGIALARRLTGSEAGSIRAFAALLLLEAGRSEEAREIGLEGVGFVGAFVKAELAVGEEKKGLHQKALALAVTPDQFMALDAQRKRLE